MNAEEDVEDSRRFCRVKLRIGAYRSSPVCQPTTTQRSPTSNTDNVGALGTSAYTHRLALYEISQTTAEIVLSLSRESVCQHNVPKH